MDPAIAGVTMRGNMTAKAERALSPAIIYCLISTIFQNFVFIFREHLNIYFSSRTGRKPWKLDMQVLGFSTWLLTRRDRKRAVHGPACIVLNNPPSPKNTSMHKLRRGSWQVLLSSTKADPGTAKHTNDHQQTKARPLLKLCSILQRPTLLTEPHYSC